LILTRFAGAVLAAPVLLLSSFPCRAEQGQLDGNPALFAVIAAIHAGGYDPDYASLSTSTLRQQIRQHLAQKNIPSVAGLKAFFKAHGQGNWSTDVSQYVSFALSVEGPPDFMYRFQPAELPPDVRSLAGFEKLMAEFYAEADLATLWNQVQPAYNEAIASYQEPVIRAVMEANAYLRNPTSGYLGRRFQIYLDLLGPSNQVQTRSYRDDYFVVVTPSAEPDIDEIRHAYFHYLLDPLSLKYGSAVYRVRGLIDYAQGAPALDTAYKDDISLLVTESLIKAIEGRLTRGGPAAQQTVVNQALAEGFVVTPALYELLAGYQKQDRSMRLYYPDLLAAIDLRKEARRLDKIEFVTTRAAKTVKAPAPPKTEPSPAEKGLEDAQALYEQRKLDESREAYMRVLQSGGVKELHAKAYYGLARIAARQRDPELAEQLFRKALDSGLEPEMQSWSLVYLGRLADAQGQREQAVESYKAALDVKGASDKAHEAAEQGLKESFKAK
jgi:tetratricopeptide (TPR) repeat protein